MAHPDEELLPPAPKYNTKTSEQEPGDWKQPTESLTLNRLCEIAQAWASMTWEDIDDKQLRALLTLSAVLVRKHSKSQLSALCENHVRREALAQDQASIVLEVYQKLHSDKGGKFEAALWQHWDRGSLTLFIHAALRAGTTIPCESSAIVVASIMSLLSNSQNDSLEHHHHHH
uniref:Nucleocapsid protein,Minor nucleoprotein VP30 n=1 Tax=Cuevavirus lloviuense TaxID=3052148 RepID=UPI0020966154|nr:Chain A, Nucleocapsid protein,Minor nucleoprotein VP30 [Cuevavirus lloviuense]7XIV_B Chain B, Nucleocapsid protein,Minor nucleoprotein VP30 [Cuevavirus lloviuense]